MPVCPSFSALLPLLSLHKKRQRKPACFSLLADTAPIPRPPSLARLLGGLPYKRQPTTQDAPLWCFALSYCASWASKVRISPCLRLGPPPSCPPLQLKSAPPHPHAHGVRYLQKPRLKGVAHLGSPEGLHCPLRLPHAASLILFVVVVVAVLCFIPFLFLIFPNK